MPSVTIDAAVLAPPTEDSPVAAVHRYIEKLLGWSKLDKSWVDIYMSEKTSEALVTDGLYPIYKDLKKLFAANGIVEYDVETVVTIAYALLQHEHTSPFEPAFQVWKVITETLSTDPDIVPRSAGTALQSGLPRCLVLIAILRQYCQELIANHALILGHAPEQVVTVRAMIQDIQHDRNDLSGLTYPHMFEGMVPICDDFEGLIQCLDAPSMLASSTDNVGLETAIRTALYKLQFGRGKEPDWNDLRGFRIGRCFLETVQESCKRGSSYPEKVLRAIVETLDGENMRATHALRRGHGGDDPQLRRLADDAGAMRRDIDQEHHLHYWLCDNGIVELASVSHPHADFSIPE